ncbi:MAG TPA: DUF4260 domain-containing protein [Rhizomicrobium sp.]|nr:DUF4260 domain-containing protein [Rhizomicrobium sp.]
MDKTDTFSGAVNGGVRALLRTEGLLLLVAAVALYARIGSGWGLFALLFLAPDLSFAGYLLGPRIGALTYNIMHSTVGPLALAAASLVFDQHLTLALALIWLAHIGFDRALGYGLKQSRGFGFTHLGPIGRSMKER